MADEIGNEWLDEIDFDPSSSWLAMGTRALNDQPWLIVDRQREHELKLRSDLIAKRRADVICAPSSAGAAVDEITGMVRHAGRWLEPLEPEREGGTEEALARLGRSIAEDLCVLRRGTHEWEFEAAVLCFPSRWRLLDRIGRPLREVHGPTPGYDPVLADRITSLLDRLGDHVVRRRNWFVHSNPALYQPDRPETEPVVDGDQILTELFLRSERQTLRSLPESGRVLFTIKTQQCALAEVVADEGRRGEFVKYVADAPLDQVNHRGISADQRAELLATLV